MQLVSAIYFLQSGGDQSEGHIGGGIGESRLSKWMQDGDRYLEQLRDYLGAAALVGAGEIDNLLMIAADRI